MPDSFESCFFAPISPNAWDVNLFDGDFGYARGFVVGRPGALSVKKEKVTPVAARGTDSAVASLEKIGREGGEESGNGHF